MRGGESYLDDSDWNLYDSDLLHTLSDDSDVSDVSDGSYEDDESYEDHINCVSNPEELAKQANFTEVLYSGTKELDSGMNRFMVIGK